MITRTLKKILRCADANRSARIFIVYGGQGAGKTYAISQILIDELMSCRYERPTMVVGYELSKLKNRAYNDFKSITDGMTSAEMQMSGCKFSNGNSVKFIGLDTDTIGLSVRTQNLFFNEISEFRKYENIKPLIDRCSGYVFIDTNPMKSAENNIRRLKEDYGDLVAEVKVTYLDNDYLSPGEIEMIEAKIRVGKDARIGSRARWEYEVFVLGNYAEVEVGEVFEFTDFEQYDVSVEPHHLFGVIDPSTRSGGDSDNCARALFGLCNVAGEDRLVLLESATDNDSTIQEIADEQNRWRDTYGSFVTYCEANGYGREFIRKLTNEIGRKNVGAYATTKEKFSKIWDSSTDIKRIMFKSTSDNAKFLRNACSFSSTCVHDDEADVLATATRFNYRTRRFDV